MHQAYSTGRAEKDPSQGWHEGDLWFFDNYIIPLAKKLKTCGVFRVSCDEFLDYANDNRCEWEEKGCDIVAQYVLDIRNDPDVSHRQQVAVALDEVIPSVHSLRSI
jgi:hypothetical protein